MTPLANRSVQPAGTEWIPAAVKGEFPHSETGKVQVLDDVFFGAVIANFYKDASKPGWTGLPLDFDHNIYDHKQRSEVAGRIVDLRRDGNVLMALTNFTQRGWAETGDGTWRYTSPVWLSNDLDDLGGDRVRPRRLDSLGLTNMPNLKTLPPITNRRGSAQSNSRFGVRPQLISNRAVPQALKNRAITLHHRDFTPAGKSMLRLQDVIATLRVRDGGTFEQTWNSFQPLLNRFSNRDGAADMDALWREAQAKEQAAFDSTWNTYATSVTNNLDRGYQLHKGVTQPRGAFLDAIRHEMNVNGWDFAQAWAKLRENEPLFWLRHIWSITEPVGGRGW